jgi:hypothetical protein
MAELGRDAAQCGRGKAHHRNEYGNRIILASHRDARHWVTRRELVLQRMVDAPSGVGLSAVNLTRNAQNNNDGR